jgi:hypothetical protein
MWVKTIINKPAMTGNGKHTTYKNGDDWGMVYYCFTHIRDITDIMGIWGYDGISPTSTNIIFVG